MSPGVSHSLLKLSDFVTANISKKNKEWLKNWNEKGAEINKEQALGSQSL